MKKLISLLLTLAMLLSLAVIPVQAEGDSAQDPLPAEGLYPAAKDGMPDGDCHSADEFFGSDNDVPVYNISYTPGEEVTLYYFHSERSDSFTLTGNNGNTDAAQRYDIDLDDISIESVGDSGHFWRITLTINGNGDPFYLDFTCKMNILFQFVSSVPAAPTYETGIYFAAEDGAPKGEAVTGDCPEEDGPWGYWDIPYDSSEAFVFYYYDSEAMDLSMNNVPDGFSSSMESVADHFWKITLQAPQAGYGSFAVDLLAGQAGFPVFFADSFVPTYERGLYYKPLRGVNGGAPYVDENDRYSNAPIFSAPYFDRSDLAFFFYDGTDFIPVDVGFSPSLCVDPVKENDQTGWYLFAAYDFCEGTIFYDDDATHTTYRIDYATVLPEFAFYAGDSVSQANFRMYTIAEENTSTDERFASYQFAKTLTFLPEDPHFSFGLGPGSSVNLDIYCFQHQYLPNGNETNEIPYTDFNYTWEAGSNEKGEYITLTLYTNDSDVLCYLNGISGGEWLYGAYVNVLAFDESDDTTTSLLFHANNQGNFAAAKFLPQHLFDELAALGRDVTIGSDLFPGDVTLDKNIVGSIADQSVPVSFCMTADAASEEDLALIAQALASGETMLDTVDLQLFFGRESKHELGGKATIKYVAELDNKTNVKVYYLNDEGQLEEMDAKYQNGNIIFSTTHFSKFVITTAPQSSSPSSPSKPSKPSKPVEDETPEEPVTPAAPSYTDVAADHWAKDAIAWAAEQGLMNGTGADTFSPAGTVTRQQVWMTLSRHFGAAPADMGEAMSWAVENGISDGSNASGAVTREQLVTLLYRYAQHVGAAVQSGADLSGYTDGDAVSDFAREAMSWAVGEGIITGTSADTLSPAGSATRAQLALILMRFCSKIG